MRMRFYALVATAVAALCPSVSFAQGAAPELYGVREVIVEYPRFDDVKTSGLCGLTRENVGSALYKAFAGTTVPVTPIIDAKPLMMGVARISLIPVVSTHMDDNMDCISWVSLSAESRTNVTILPVTTVRSITAVYWRGHTKLVTSQSQHADKFGFVIQKLGEQFAQQYKLDQPPELPKIPK